ncbi:hypothetical protein AABB24_008317 [Solanum stoloniferum]|uniref:Uncharacterized protein n=1 Tax=Solanum stoloniferum TaxID=62892 RepID=A0ABD2UTJ8_9SOLN
MRTKHMELDCHFVRQQYISGLISLQFTPSKIQLADLFTKPLSGFSHHGILSKLGVSSLQLSSLPSNLRGDVGKKKIHASLVSLSISSRKKERKNSEASLGISNIKRESVQSFHRFPSTCYMKEI